MNCSTAASSSNTSSSSLCYDVRRGDPCLRKVDEVVGDVRQYLVRHPDTYTCVSFIFFRLVAIPGIHPLPLSCHALIRRTRIGVTFLLPGQYAERAFAVIRATQDLKPGFFELDERIEARLLGHDFRGGAVFSKEDDFVDFFSPYGCRREELVTFYREVFDLRVVEEGPAEEGPVEEEPAEEAHFVVAGALPAGR